VAVSVPGVSTENSGIRVQLAAITGQAVKDAMTGDFLHHGRAIGVEFVELVREMFRVEWSTPLSLRSLARSET